MAYLKEHSLEFPGVQVETSYLRQYPFGALATHLLGYVGEVSQTDLDQEQFSTLKAGATVGKDGVERTYDSYLRGTDGWKTVEVDAAGQPKRVLEDVAPTAGQQPGAHHRQRSAGRPPRMPWSRGSSWRTTQSRLRPTRPAAPWWPWTRSTGEILAMASYPDYDPSLWVGGMSHDASTTELNAHAGPQPAVQPGHQRPLSGRLHLQALRGRRRPERRPHHPRDHLRLRRASSPAAGQTWK